MCFAAGAGARALLRVSVAMALLWVRDRWQGYAESPWIAVTTTNPFLFERAAHSSTMLAPVPVRASGGACGVSAVDARRRRTNCRNCHKARGREQHHHRLKSCLIGQYSVRTDERNVWSDTPVPD